LGWRSLLVTRLPASADYADPIPSSGQALLTIIRHSGSSKTSSGHDAGLKNSGDFAQGIEAASSRGFNGEKCSILADLCCDRDARRPAEE